jgi:hypothetical protein
MVCDKKLPHKQKHKRTQYEPRTQHRTAAAIYRTCCVLSTSILNEFSLLFFNKALFKAAQDNGSRSCQKWMSFGRNLSTAPRIDIHINTRLPTSEAITGASNWAPVFATPNVGQTTPPTDMDLDTPAQDYVV